VPPVAELLLLKRLEEDVLQDVRVFRAATGETTDPELMTARMKLLERLGHRHTEMTDMFDALVKQQTDPNAGDEKKDDAKDSGGGDGGAEKDKKDEKSDGGDGEKSKDSGGRR
jgi:hypothetical protein